MDACIPHLHTLFNNKLADFVDDLRPLIQDMPEYTMLRAAVDLMARVQPTQNHNLFVRYVMNNYRDRIMVRDEGFFLNNAYDEIADGVSIVSVLKRFWSKFSETDKHSIWGHLGVLVAISDLILQKSS
jgi:hypothetical protein